jgi:heat shock protein HslJ
MPRLALVTVGLFSALAVAACGGTLTAPSVATVAPAASLAIETNAIWHLRSMTSAGGSVQAIEDPNLFALTLTDAGRITLRVDCNRAMGGYTISASTVSIGPLASTKAYCGEASYDSEFLTLLGGDTTATSSGNILQLSSPRGVLTFDR